MTELSRPFALDRLGAAGAEFVVEAGPEECAALARRLMIPAVHRLRCSFRLRRGGGSLIEAAGDLEAEVVQVCVATLDEFAQDVRERFNVQFVPEGTQSEDDDPELPDQLPYAGGAIDLGETAAEQLALALDPYPRRPDAPELGSDADESLGPFAALAGLRRPQ